jgi:phosphate starvation-inducible protein PhoH
MTKFNPLLCPLLPCRVMTVAASTQNRYFSNVKNTTVQLGNGARFTGATWWAAF